MAQQAGQGKARQGKAWIGMARQKHGKLFKMQKIFILGGRSGTSTMARLLQAAGLSLWSTAASTEPPYIQSAILNHIDDPEKIKKAFSINKSSWQVAKLPEFAFCLPIISELWPDAKYICMARHIDDRVESHVNLGWHVDISERMIENEALKEFIEQKTGERISAKDHKWNDRLCFGALDACFVDFFINRKEQPLFLKYEDFCSNFGAAMLQVANYLEIGYWNNIETWRKIKAIPQQAGKWRAD